MAKGAAKRKSSHFRPGHHASYKPRSWKNSEKSSKRERIVRTDQNDFQEINKDADPEGVISVENGELTDRCTLRPTEEKTYLEEYETSSPKKYIYGIVHFQKETEFWNSVVKQHRQYRQHCNGDLRYDDDRGEKWGLAWSKVLRCDKCGFISKKHKLYSEIDTGKPGRKPADINRRIPIGLSRHGIGISGFIDIMCSGDIAPPSYSSLQKSTNKIDKVLQKAGKEDMKKRRAKLKRTKLHKGQSPVIDIESDGRYNNRPGGASGHTPFQPASQVIYTICENETDNKEIIYVGAHSKQHNCEDESDCDSSCPGDLPPGASIGDEGKYLVQGIEELNDEGLSIRYLTVDGDTCARSAVKDIDQSNTTDPIKVMYCTRHLSNLQEREVKSCKFSSDMFPVGTQAEKKRAQDTFACDIADRCHAEYNKAFSALHNDIGALKSKLCDITTGIIECYSGDCTQNCHKHSFVCEEGNPWPRPYINTSSLFSHLSSFIQPTDDDITKLKHALHIRLGDRAVEKTLTNANQNKCEACNRGFTKVLPKHLHVGKNFRGRAHSAVMSMNNGPGEALVKLCDAAGAPLSPDSKVVQHLKQMDKRIKYQKEKKKSDSQKLRRRQLRQSRYKQYSDLKEDKMYNKHQCPIEDIVFTPTQGKHVDDHTYSTRRKLLLSKRQKSKLRK